MHARVLLCVAFACSGAAALIYEIAWTRLLALFMGHTVAAAGSVLAAFMGGLAIGAAVAGRISPRLTRAVALRAYASLEILIALLALALPFEIDVLRPLLVASYADGDGGTLFAATRLGCALLVVALPAIAMGATWPLIVRAAVSAASQAGCETAVLYAVNAGGAALGAVLSGFVLLPALGMRATTTIAVAVNVVSAAMALVVARSPNAAFLRADVPVATRAATKRKTRVTSQYRTSAAPATSHRAIAAAAVAISGCASLVLQVAWTRILALVIGPTTYAFSAMVATFIAGIALGSLAGGWIGRRGPAPHALAWSLLISGLAAVAAAAWAPHIPIVVAEAVAAPGASFTAVVRLQSLIVAALMLPMTIAFGVSFPLAVGLVVHDDRRVAADVAMVYAANTIGAVSGALAAGFLLIPWIGLQHTVRCAAVLTILAAALVAAAHAARSTRALSFVSVAAAAAVGVWFTPAWDHALLSSGAYKYAAYLPAENRHALLRAGTVLFYAEGAAATVSVRHLAGTTSLAIDGKIDASNAGDMLTQRLLAHAPLLLHPAPRRVAIIGLGSGVTLGSALRHPVERVDTVEISPDVVEASAHFLRENGGALADRRSRLIVGDGRSHLMLGTEPYDVIISEPSNPWIAGVASLFTRELFNAARTRLAPGGLFCQWAHAYDMSDADVRSIVGTFVGVFPEASLWLIGDSDLLLIGAIESLDARLALVPTNWQRPGVAADLTAVGVAGPDLLLSLLTATAPALRAYAAGAAIQRDDRLALEFTGPRGIYGESAARNAEMLRSLATDATTPSIIRAVRESPANKRDRGLMLFRAEAFAEAARDLRRAVEHDPHDAVAIDGLILAAGPANRIEDVERLLRRLTGQDPGNVAAAVGLSRIFSSHGNVDEAVRVLRSTLAVRQDIRASNQLASVFADAGDPQRLAGVLAELQRMAPDADSTLYFTAVHHLMTGRPGDAVRVGERLRGRSTVRARDLTLLGAAYGELGRADDARRAFEAARSADPRDATNHENLGALALAQGHRRVAAGHFAEALTVDPASPVARRGLAEALNALR